MFFNSLLMLLLHFIQNNALGFLASRAISIATSNSMTTSCGFLPPPNMPDQALVKRRASTADFAWVLCYWKCMKLSLIFSMHRGCFCTSNSVFIALTEKTHLWFVVFLVRNFFCLDNRSKTKEKEDAFLYSKLISYKVFQIYRCQHCGPDKVYCKICLVNLLLSWFVATKWWLKVCEYLFIWWEDLFTKPCVVWDWWKDDLVHNYIHNTIGR